MAVNATRLSLTERAADHLQEVYDYTRARWGEKQADIYLKKIYQQLQKLAANPDIGASRAHRSEPYLMAPTQQHYAIYKTWEKGIIVAAILHSKRDIESIINQIGASLALEIDQIEKAAAFK